MSGHFYFEIKADYLEIKKSLINKPRSFFCLPLKVGSSLLLSLDTEAQPQISNYLCQNLYAKFLSIFKNLLSKREPNSHTLENIS